MFTRTVPKQLDIPEREQVEHETMCPPHDFDAAWALPAGDSLDGDSNVPALYCHMCGEVRLFRIPSDAA